MKTLYVGCALRGAPAEFVAAVTQLKEKLETQFEVFHFIGLGTTTPAIEIYETDINLAITAELMLAICDQPSTGLGIEIAARAARGLPTVIAQHTSVSISAMVLGLAATTPSFSVISYDDFDTMVTYMDGQA